MINVVSPGTKVLMNKVPKSYAIYDLYFNLIPDDDQNNDCYEQVP